MSTARERIAARIRATREQAGLSQEAAAHLIGVTSRNYARWERMEGYGYLDRLDDIAKAFGVSESDLLGGEDLLTATPTVEDLAAKLDQVLEEVRQIREDLESPTRRRR